MEHKSSLSKVIGTNIKILRDTLKKSQKEFAKETKISTPTLSSYENNASYPSLEFLLYLKETYHINLDSFITETLTATEIHQQLNAISEAYIQPNVKKYFGTYIVYYFTTGTYGNEQQQFLPAESLRMGLLTLYPKTSTGVNAIACFNLEEPLLKVMYRSIQKETHAVMHADDIHYITQNYLKANETNVYKGNVTFSVNNIYINLNHTNRDCSLIILSNPNSEQPEYYGGLGTINSVSKGFNFEPCIQYIGLSRYPLSISLDEISRELQFTNINLNMYNETVELVNAFKNLYTKTTLTALPFSDEQKVFLLQSLLEKFVDEAITANLFRTHKISSEQDNKWYHLIKKHLKKE